MAEQMQLDSSQLILDVDAAYSLCQTEFKSVHHELMSWCDSLEQLIGDQNYTSEWDYQKLISVARHAFTIAAATFSRRYGTGEDNTHQSALHYHNAGHALDIVHRIDKMVQVMSLDQFPPERRILLTLFAVSHDLEQNVTEPPQNGVGSNEIRSADETVDILERAIEHASVAGPDASRIKDYFFDPLRYMIYGTTFNFGPRTEQVQNLFNQETVEAQIPTGALAPLLVEHIKVAFPDWSSNAQKQLLIENILLGADIDTANVSDDFYDFALQGVNLCRELERRKGLEECDPQATYNFMTTGQEYYFHTAQRYNSDLSKSSFADAKSLNATRLAISTRQLREAFGDPNDDFKTLRQTDEDPIDAEQIFARYLGLANSLRHKSEEELAAIK